MLTSDPAVEVAKKFELDVRRVEVLTSGVLLLEQLSQLLGQPLQIGKGGLREGVILGTIAGGVRKVHSFPIGSGSLAEEFIKGDPPGPAEIRKLRDAIEEAFAGVDLGKPDQAVAVGGSATSLRRLVGAVLEYETLERGIRVLTSDPAVEVAKKFELDVRRVEVLASGVLVLEQLSQLLGQPLQIGKGGLREGIILELLSDGTAESAAA